MPTGSVVIVAFEVFGALQFLQEQFFFSSFPSRPLLVSCSMVLLGIIECDVVKPGDVNVSRSARGWSHLDMTTCFHASGFTKGISDQDL